MALLTCPECGHLISVSAATCPECGHPIDTQTRARMRKAAARAAKKNRKMLLGFGIVALLLVGTCVASVLKSGPVTYDDVMRQREELYRATGQLPDREYLEWLGRKIQKGYASAAAGEDAIGQAAGTVGTAEQHEKADAGEPWPPLVRSPQQTEPIDWHEFFKNRRENANPSHTASRRLSKPLSKSERQAIWHELVDAEEEANGQVERKYPPLWQMIQKDRSFATKERAIEYVSSQARMRDRLIAKYENDIAAKYGLTSDDLDLIAVEAAANKW